MAAASGACLVSMFSQVHLISPWGRERRNPRYEAAGRVLAKLRLYDRVYAVVLAYECGPVKAGEREA